MKRLAVIIGMAAAIGLVLWFLSQEARPGGSDVPTPRRVRNSSDVDLPLAVQGIGYVEPTSEVRRLSFATYGVIAECRVEIGDRVKRGDVLARLRNDEEMANVRLAESELQLARAEEARLLRGLNDFQIKSAEKKADALRHRIEFLQKEHSRAQELLERRASTESNHDRMRSDLFETEAELAAAESEVAHLKSYVLQEDKEVAAAKVRSAEARIQVAKERFAETELLAPWDGTVLEILRREGESVSGIIPDPVLLLADMSQQHVRAEIDEQSAHLLQAGQAAVVGGRNLRGRTYQGRVIVVKEIMGAKTVFTRAATERRDLEVLQVLIEMDPDFRAPVGLRVDVSITTGER